MNKNLFNGLTFWLAVIGSVFVSPVLWNAVEPAVVRALAERYEADVAGWLRIALYWLNFALVYSALRASLTLALSAIFMYGAARYFAFA